jgi:hypothetical protein
MELLREIQKWGGSATFSMNSNNTPWLWKTIGWSCAPNEWRVGVKDGVTASIQIKMEEKNQKIIQKRILSTAVTTETMNFNSSSGGDENNNNNNTVFTDQQKSMPFFTLEQLQKMKVLELQEICSKYNIKKGMLFYK